MSSRWQRVTAGAATGTLIIGAVAASGGSAAATVGHTTAAAPGVWITQTNLVSDQAGVAKVTDASLVNPWGMSFGTGASPSPVWVSNNGTGTSTLYRGATVPPTAAKVPLTVTIPWDAPTGQVFNASATDFMVSSGTATGAAKFIFDSATGWITGWSPTVPAAGSTAAQDAVDIPGAVFTGLAIATVSSAQYLYAADFHGGVVDVFNSSFKKISFGAKTFKDALLPKGYAPFNVQELRGAIYVSYAMQDPTKTHDAARLGRGWVDVYTTSGKLIKRLVKGGVLDSPWGLAIAPASWGKYAGTLLVGNFGNGRIHSYDARTGKFVGALFGQDGKALTIDGLWGLLPGNGVSGDPQSVLFTAGPDGGTHGLFGELTAPAAG
jgi:uncharacterized protein (TIGR03118 family)